MHIVISEIDQSIIPEINMPIFEKKFWRRPNYIKKLVFLKFLTTKDYYNPRQPAYSKQPAGKKINKAL